TGSCASAYGVSPRPSTRATTCEDVQDFHFIPGPIRVFPGSFPSGPRPSRIAGVWLRDAQNVAQGALVVAGVAAEATDAGTGELPAAKLVDADNVVDAMNNTAPLKEPASLSIDAPPVDVVAFQPLPGADPLPGASAPVFILTQEAAGVPAQVLAYSVSPSANGPVATETARCSLNFVATRLALIAGESDKLYIADGTPDGVVGGIGDGAVEILTSTMPAPDQPLSACVINRRFSAQDPADGSPQPLRSIALAPKFRTSDGRNFKAGEVLGGVTQDGRVVFLSATLGGPMPLPPLLAPYLDDSGNPHGEGTSAPRMEPLRTNGLARDILFLNQPLTCPAGTVAGNPCQLVRVGASGDSARSVQFAQVAGVSASDGAVYFLDVDLRRFISETRDGVEGQPQPTPTITSDAAFSPVQPNGQDAPTFTWAPALTKDVTTDGKTSTVTVHTLGWYTPGVTRRALWKATWHAPIPGLTRRGGTLSRAPDGVNLELDLQTDLSNWQGINELDVGDVVAFEAFSNPSASLCAELSSENANPLAREYKILSITAGPTSSTLIITPTGTATAGDDGGVPDTFNPPDNCLPAGAVGEVRVANGFGGRAWLVTEGLETRGRAKNGEQFVAYETRFDYPLDYDPNGVLPTPDLNTALSFTIGGNEPIVPGSYYTWALDSAHQPTNVRDATYSFGFAGPLTVYTSKKITGNLIFVSQSGANAVLQIDPALIGVENGVLAYR
ncbi:MAG: hypothetical protein JST92_18215, partial [Deltaproteobacteria bacterium]|nr:hypothetical protein [Deltaproteobacteria bacterium]